MNRPLRNVLACAVTIGATLFGSPQTSFAQDATPVTYSQGVGQGKIRIKLTESALNRARISSNRTISNASIGLSSVDAVSKQFQASNMKPVFPFDGVHDEAMKRHGLHLWFEVDVNPMVSAQTVVATYSALAEVEIAENILEKRNIEEVKNTRVVNPRSTQSTNEGLPMNDPLLSRQWHYENDGTEDSWTEDADINLFDAWNINTGSNEIIVSVHDGGIDVAHEDLAANIWVNTGEIPGNGVDDDQNGYIDDVNGYNFAYAQGEIVADVHGTHVAGTVAAVSNNGIGVAGVAGGNGSGNGVKLMSLPIINGPEYADIAASYVYAANNGAVISQNSWGYTIPDVYEQSVLDGIDYFIAEAGHYEGSPMTGGIVIFAAGNDNSSADYYPTRYDNVLAVASTGPQNIRAGYSNYGPWVDITAPGGDIQANLNQNDMVLSTLPGNAYGYLDGTSMACPHVSGIAALILSEYGSDTYTPELLWNRLVNSTNNIDALNPNYVGLLGPGIIDAGLALKVNEGAAPQKVTELVESGSSFDFINLSWTVPSDDDDDEPVSFIVYYDSVDFSADASMADFVQVKNFTATGETFMYELAGLVQETSYYVSVAGVDRWGNIGEMSDMLMTATTAGPSIVLSDELLSVDHDVMGGNMANTMFTISNEGEGILRYETEVGQSDFIVDTYSNTKENAQLGRSLNSTLQMKTVHFRDVNMVNVEDDPALDEYDDRWLTYSSVQTFSFITSPEEKPNSPISTIAAYYVVDQDGFNLTDVFAAAAELTVGKPMVEVRVGNPYTTAKVVYTGDLGDRDWYGFRDVSLEEDVNIPYNSIVWLKISYEAGNELTTGVVINNNTDDLYFTQEADNSQFISFDNEQSFSRLIDADPLGRSLLFVQGLQSANEHLGNYVSLVPFAGDITTEEPQDVAVSLDATTLRNGTYTSNVIINSNDQENQEVKLPVTFKVSGQQADLRVSEEIINIGTEFIGGSIDATITVGNYGYGYFNVADVSVEDNVNFKVITQSSKVPARGRATFGIEFRPQSVGNFNTNLVLTDTEGNVKKFRLFAVGAAPSEITISPAEFTTENLAVGESTTGSFEISNTGDYPLSFNIPKYSDNAPEGVHKYGYSWEKKDNADNWVEIAGAEGTVDLGHWFRETAELYYPVKLPFEMPFYDGFEGEFFFNFQGVLTFDKSTNLNGPPQLGSPWYNKGIISGAFQQLDLGKGGDVLMKAFDTYVVFEMKDVVPQWSNGTITYQIILFDNGDIEFIYQDLSGLTDIWGSNDTKRLWLAIEDRAQQDAMLIHEYDWESEKYFFEPFENVSVRVYHPGTELATDFSVTEGLISPGESMAIDFSVTATNVLDGINIQRVGIVSNDPSNPLKVFTIKTTVDEGTMEDLSVSTEELNYGQIFLDNPRDLQVTLLNSGTKSSVIESITLANGNFIVDRVDAEVKPKHTVNINVTMPADALGAVSDVMTITNANGDVYTVNLSGEVINPPAISLDQTPLEFNLDVGDQTTTTITVSNGAGGSTLDFIPQATTWFYPTPMAEASNTIRDFVYTQKDNKTVLAGGVDDAAPKFKWENAYTEGQKIEFTQPFESQEFQLPYPIKFYDKEYDKIYLTDYGIVGFEPIDYLRFGNAIGTQGDDMDNFIAVMFTQLISLPDDYDPTPNKGLYVHHDDEKIVISYRRYQRVFALFGGFVNAQVILYKDGNIKLQYTTDNQNGVDFWSPNLAIGMENEDASNYNNVASYVSFIEDKAVVEFAPARKMTLAPGESKDIEFTVDARRLLGGTYSTDIEFQNLTPGMEDISVPVTLNVSGAAEGAFSTEEISYVDYIIDGTEAVNEFTFMNNGSDNFNISSLSTEGMGNVTVEFEVIFNNPFLGPMVDWVPIEYFADEVNWGSVSDVIVPSESMKFRVRFTPSIDNPSFTDKFIVTDVDGNAVELPISLTSVLPPTLGLNGDDIYINADTREHTSSHTFEVSNAEGLSTLTYEIVVDFLRTAKAQATETLSSFFSTDNELAVETKSAPIVATKSTNEEVYYEYLNYDEEEAPLNFIGFNGGIFTSATGFHAPVEGMELSHVQTWYRPLGIDNGRITVNVLAGSDIETARVLHTETFTTESSKDDENGKLETFELSETQFIYPNEKFYIAFTYEVGLSYPQGIVNLGETVPGAFYIPSQDGWFDISTDPNFSTIGWMTRAASMTAADKPWLILDSYSGELEEGATATITADIDAMNITEDSVSAIVKVMSNDPFSNGESLEISVINNQAPHFNDVPMYVDAVEGIESMIQLNIEDLEMDTYTIETVGLSSVGGELMNSEENGDYIVMTPDFEAEGEHMITVTVTDEHGATRTIEIIVTVANGNRLPTGIDMEDLSLEVGSLPYHIDPTTIFADEDDVELSYAISAVDSDVVLVGYANGNFTIVPISVGNSEVTLTAMDSDGGSVAVTFNTEVIAEQVTSIDPELAAAANLSNYPNPVLNSTTFSFSTTEIAEASIMVYNMNGQLLDTISVGKVSNGNHKVSYETASLQSGVYVYTLILNGKVVAYSKFVK